MDESLKAVLRCVSSSTMPVRVAMWSQGRLGRGLPLNSARGRQGLHGVAGVKGLC